MNSAAKVTLAIGGIVTFIGIIGFILGSSSFADIKPIHENSRTGSVFVEDTENDGHLGFSFYVDGDRYVDSNEDGQWDHCEGVVIEIQDPPDSTGDPDFYFEIVDYGFLFYDECEAHPENVRYDSPGKLKIGRACAGCYEGTFIFTSNTPVQVWDDEAAIEGIFQGIGAICLGGGGVCCGILILVLGIIFALTLEDNKGINDTKLIFDQEGRVISTGESITSGDYVAVSDNNISSDEIGKISAENENLEEVAEIQEVSNESPSWFDVSEDES